MLSRAIIRRPSVTYSVTLSLVPRHLSRPTCPSSGRPIDEDLSIRVGRLDQVLLPRGLLAGWPQPRDQPPDDLFENLVPIAEVVIHGRRRHAHRAGKPANAEVVQPLVVDHVDGGLDH